MNIFEGVVPGITIGSIGTILGRNGEFTQSSISVRGPAKITGVGDASAIKIFIDDVLYEKERRIK